MVQGAVHGKRRVWRHPREANSTHCIKRHWKGQMTFIFWGCFTWSEIGPCYCWPKETAKMTEQYQKLMDKYNKAHEEEDREAWELETKIKRLDLVGKGGRKPT